MLGIGPAGNIIFAEAEVQAGHLSSDAGLVFIREMAPAEKPRSGPRFSLVARKGWPMALNIGAPAAGQPTVTTS